MEKVVQAKREDANSPAFEDILGRLGVVVERLESGELPLEESLKLFEEGVRLSRSGSARLDEAERRIERLLHSEARDGSLSVSTEVVESRELEGRGSAHERSHERSKETEVP